MAHRRLQKPVLFSQVEPFQPRLWSVFSVGCPCALGRPRTYDIGLSDPDATLNIAQPTSMPVKAGTVSIG